MARKKHTKKNRQKKSRTPSALRRWWREMDDERRGRLLRVCAWTFALLAVVTGGAWGMKRLEQRIIVRSAQADIELGVRLPGRPGWMPRSELRRIAGDLVADCGGYHQRDLTRRVYDNAVSDPWIREVKRVRKYRGEAGDMGVVDVEAEYRRPVARAGCDGQYYYVDADGVRLPETEVPKYLTEPDGRREYFTDPSRMPPDAEPQRLHYIVVELHREFDPPEPPVGQPWQSDALTEGLKLVERVLSEPYAGEITVVDVRNYRCREISNEPELTMFAQTGRQSPTRILFGRFPEQGGDFIVSPERKFAYLDSFYSENGRLAGPARELDLRHDHLLVVP
ncbi:MAG: hypothetical protein ACOC9S_03255 [Planctomycetota bacterium]